MNTIQSRHTFHYLDGLRGLASLAVAIWHFYLAFCHSAIVKGVIMPKFLDWVYLLPTNIFFAGDAAVYVFFIMSGFVLSVRYFTTKEVEPVKRSFLKRYIRLMLPCFPSVILAYILLKNNLFFNHTVGQAIDSWWLNFNLSNITPHFKEALYYVVFGNLFVGVPADAAYNSNLGTLRVELLGSFIIFGFIVISHTLKLRILLRMLGYIIITMVGLKITKLYGVFFIGMAFADIYSNYRQHLVKFTRYRKIFAFLLFILGIYGLSCNGMNREIYHYHGLHDMWLVGAIALFLSCMFSTMLQKFFCTKPLQFLGKISFTLYLTHTVILLSFGCFVYSKLIFLTPGIRTLITFTLYMLCTFLAVLIFQKVDERAIKFSQKLG